MSVKVLKLISNFITKIHLCLSDWKSSLAIQSYKKSGLNHTTYLEFEIYEEKEKNLWIIEPLQTPFIWSISSCTLFFFAKKNPQKFNFLYLVFWFPTKRMIFCLSWLQEFAYCMVWEVLLIGGWKFVFIEPKFRLKYVLQLTSIK